MTVMTYGWNCRLNYGHRSKTTWSMLETSWHIYSNISSLEIGFCFVFWYCTSTKLFKPESESQGFHFCNGNVCLAKAYLGWLSHSGCVLWATSLSNDEQAEHHFQKCFVPAKPKSPQHSFPPFWGNIWKLSLTQLKMTKKTPLRTQNILRQSWLGPLCTIGPPLGCLSLLRGRGWPLSGKGLPTCAIEKKAGRISPQDQLCDRPIIGIHLA